MYEFLHSQSQNAKSAFKAACPLFAGADMDRSPPSLIAVHYICKMPRGSVEAVRLLTELLRGKNFWGGGDGVVRISEAVAHGWLPARDRDRPLW